MNYHTTTMATFEHSIAMSKYPHSNVQTSINRYIVIAALSHQKVLVSFPRIPFPEIITNEWEASLHIWMLPKTFVLHLVLILLQKLLTAVSCYSRGCFINTLLNILVCSMTCVFTCLYFGWQKQLAKILGHVSSLCLQDLIVLVTKQEAKQTKQCPKE